MVFDSGDRDVVEAHEQVFQEKKMAETDKSWERPWSTNEIRKNSDNWTLAGDVGLLKHLQEFSHQLISRTHEMEKVVDSLMHQSMETSAKVNNVINDFQMLSNLKFVENRVYDEDITDTKENQEVLPKTKEQREAEMVPRIKQALELGLSVLDNAFERIDVEETSDSEEEDLSQGRTILEPKDLYEHRPLPFIIGSDVFQNDDFAGLKYMVDEEILLDDNVSPSPDENLSLSEDSESETDEDLEFEPKKPIPSEEPFVSEPKQKQIFHDDFKNKMSDSEGSDLFGAEENGYVSSSSVDEPPKQTEPTKQSEAKKDFLEELGSKLKPAPPTVEKPAQRTQSVSSVKNATVPKKNDDGDNLFTNDDSFLDNEEEDSSVFGRNRDLFGTNASLTSTKEVNYAPLDDDLFGKSETLPEVRKEKPLKEKTAVAVSKKKDVPSFFDDDDENEQDLFGSFSSSNISTEPSRAKTVTKASSTRSVEKVAKASPSPTSKESVKSFGMAAKSNDSLFGTDSDNDDLFSSFKAPQSKKSFDLGFEDDDDDFLFGTNLKDKKEPKQETKEISKPKPTKVPESLFDDDSDDFGLFGSRSPIKKLEVKQEEKLPKKEDKPAKRTEHFEPESSIFAEEESSDLFAAVTNLQEIQETKPESPKVLKSSELEEDVSIRRESVQLQRPEDRTESKHELQMENQMKPVIDIQASKSNSEVGFDKPIDSANTLTALNKDRVKVQAKRRKPTRKGRQAIQNIDSEQDKTTEKEPEASVPKVLNKVQHDDLFLSVDTQSETKAVESKPTPPRTFKSKEQDKKNLMSQLISEAAISQIGKKRSSFMEPEEEDDDDDDLFKDIKSTEKHSDFSFVSPSELKTGDLLSKTVEDGGKKESLLASDISDDELFAEPSLTALRNDVGDTKSAFSLDDDDDDDDIFKAVKVKDTVSLGSDDIFADSGDDIFANMDKEKYGMFPRTQFDDDDDDEDDIFSNLEKPTKTFAKDTKTAMPVKDGTKKPVNVFDDPLGGLSLND